MKKHNIEVLVLTFNALDLALDYREKRKVPFPMIRDPERTVYQNFGMLRGTWMATYGPITFFKYLILMVRGWMPGKGGEDWRQMGGDVLVDPNGVIRLHYASRDPHDRPTVESLIEVVQSYR